MTDIRRLAGLMRSLAIYYGRPWRIAALADFYAQFLKPGDLAFDIGAHVGNRSRAMARCGARVVALEPQDLFHRFLKRTMPDTVTVLPQAVGATAATGTIAVSRLHPTVSSLAPDYAETVGRSESFRQVTWDREEPIDVITLDALIAEYGRPAFIKIDVEGYEAEVLAGLSQPVQAVSFEYLAPTLDVALASIDRLQRLGAYEFNLVRGEGSGFLSDDWQDADGMRATLRRMAADGRPGDVYARLREGRRRF